VTVDRIRVDDATDQLEASIRVALAGGETGMIAVQGRAEQRRPLPALRRSLRKGQLVSVENITESWISVRRIPADAITDSAALIGREASRLLPASRPLRAADVRSPILVHEDDPVTVTYRRLGMELAAGALADEDGALHDIIRVRNPGNGKQARGRVLGAGQVEIIAGPEVAP
jgi:flagella basal body P-ring formation protein FlgA